MVNAAEGVADTIQSELAGLSDTSEPEPAPEPAAAVTEGKADEDEAQDAPTPMMKKALASGASFAIGASKKGLDLVVSYVRPTLRVDSLVDPAEIRAVLRAADDTDVPAQTRVELALNHPMTAPEARRLYEQTSTEFRETLAKVEAESQDDEQGLAEVWRQIVDHWTGTDSVIRILVEAVEAAVRRDGATLRARAKRGIELDASFNNPIVAMAMLDPALGGQLSPAERRAWLERALFYFPTDQKLLGALGELVGPAESRVLDQLAQFLDQATVT